MADNQEMYEYEVDVDMQEKTEQAKPERVQSKGKPELEIEIEDDTPEEDRGRDPVPKEMVDKLDQEAELGEYDEAVKSKLRAMKKVYHDERREKERAAREREEAITLAQKIIEENKKLKARLTQGEQIYADTAKDAAQRAVEMAKREYREAYDAGDGEALASAQEKLTQATMAMQRVNDFKPTLQTEEKEVEIQPQKAQPPQMDEKTSEWMSKNPWFGSPRHKAMSSFAYGLHEELLDEYGHQFVGSDEYFKRIDKRVRTTFPDYFRVEGDEAEETRTSQLRVKAGPVVAPASRSTASKKVKLKQSQLTVAKKLGITPEQYAKEFLKLEN
jgi:hypothetical protein